MARRKTVQNVLTPSAAIAEAIAEKKEEISKLNQDLKDAKQQLKELEKDFKTVRAREEQEARENELLTLAALLQKSGMSVEEIKEKLEL
jgi:archaellum component FlaC